jgi:energy-coupling factor transporter ATP-binding protein EcfA2
VGEITPSLLRSFTVALVVGPGLETESQAVAAFFKQINRTVGQAWGVHFALVDRTNLTAGVGAPATLFLRDALERYKDSLVLIVALVGESFADPGSLTHTLSEAELSWALDRHAKEGYPELKWFFKKVEHLPVPKDPELLLAAVKAWTQVVAFRKRLETGTPSFLVGEYTDAASFRDVLSSDVTTWITAPDRPWVPRGGVLSPGLLVDATARHYYNALIEDLRWLDISGIDKGESFRIPLSEMYIRLRVVLQEDGTSASGPPRPRAKGMRIRAVHQEDIDSRHDAPDESESIGIHGALAQHKRMVIVGEPGSGKTTFLRFIALMIARAMNEGISDIAESKLGLTPPLPIPILISCWDFSNYLAGGGKVAQRKPATVDSLLLYLSAHFTNFQWPMTPTELAKLLSDGTCCVLLDGLDEVPTSNGRSVLSRLVDEVVRIYPQNRYVLTSRTRAYTGDVTLKSEFTRCDVQNFEPEDRIEFLRNWVAQLHGVPKEDVLKGTSECRRDFESLVAAIEQNHRIAQLTVNPLLLTVVAIVHRDRKQLPEQRAELYDECVDVLLGQRKEAEHAHRTKTPDFDEGHEDQEREGRTWSRKRFGEIALQILRGKTEEITKAKLVESLAQRFTERSSGDPEKAVGQAERFLEREELRSGLLVKSRGTANYRFIHLTFQEYLAAWSLSTQPLAAVKEIVGDHLREARWFETLQLLGAEWAKRSDDTLDAYIDYLLESQGKRLMERAPVVALCGNILADTSNIATVTPSTREKFLVALKSTLHAFKRDSAVPPLTQVEIVVALGTVGAPVKTHLQNATGSAYWPVRRAAIRALAPHLSEDELFKMSHLLADRAAGVIEACLVALFARNPMRALAELRKHAPLGTKGTAAVVASFGVILDGLVIRGVEAADLLEILKGACRLVPKPSAVTVLIQAGWQRLLSYEPARDWIRSAIDAEPPPVRVAALELLPAMYSPVGEEAPWDRIIGMAMGDDSTMVRQAAVAALGGALRAAQGASDRTAGGPSEIRARARAALMRSAEDDPDWIVRLAALRALWNRERRRRLAASREALLRAREAVLSPETADAASAGPDGDVMTFILRRAEIDPSDYVRLRIMTDMAREGEDNEWQFIGQRASTETTPELRSALVGALLETSRSNKYVSVLMSRDLDGAPPAVDPQESVGTERVAAAAAKLKLEPAQIIDIYHKIDEFFVPLRLEFDGPDPPRLVRVNPFYETEEVIDDGEPRPASPLLSGAPPRPEPPPSITTPPRPEPPASGAPRAPA